MEKYDVKITITNTESEDKISSEATVSEGTAQKIWDTYFSIIGGVSNLY